MFGICISFTLESELVERRKGGEKRKISYKGLRPKVGPTKFPCNLFLWRDCKKCLASKMGKLDLPHLFILITLA